MLRNGGVQALIARQMVHVRPSLWHVLTSRISDPFADQEDGPDGPCQE